MKRLTTCKLIILLIVETVIMIAGFAIIQWYSIRQIKIVDSREGAHTENTGYVFDGIGAENCIDMEWDLGSSNTHRSFGSICVGRNNEAYVVFRAGNSHGVGWGETIGDIYWSVSYDEGVSWEEPKSFLEAEDGRDLRDITLTYDNLIDRYFLIYTNVSIDYEFGERELNILMGKEPFVGMDDVSPDNPPFNLMNQSFSTMRRHGSYFYLPIYGKNDGDKQHSVSLYRALYNDSLDDISEWKELHTWNNDDDNESCIYFVYNEEKDLTRYYMIFRRGTAGDGYIAYSDDQGYTWSQKEELGFCIAGGGESFRI